VELIERIERGEGPGSAPVRGIAGALGLDPWWLMFGIDARRRASARGLAQSLRTPRS